MKHAARKSAESQPEIEASEPEIESIPLYRGDPDPVPFFNQPLQHFVLIVAVAGIVRLLHFFSLRANDPSFGHLLAGVDTKTYDDLAQLILGGDWMLRAKPVHYMGPLYAYFLAAVYGIFGHSYSAAHAAQFAMGALAAGILYLATRQWFANRVALLAGLFAALSSTLLVYEGFLLPEGFLFFLTTLLLLALGRARNRPEQWWRWPLLGVALGLVAIQRANILLFAPVLALWLLFGFRPLSMPSRTLRIALLALGVILALAPVTLHNRVFGGQWVLVTSNGPVNLYIGNGKGAPGVFGETALYQQHAREIAAGQGSWRGYLIEEISAEPYAWLGLMLKKTYMYWAAYDIADNFNFYLYKTFSPFADWSQFPFYIIVAAGFVGISLSLRRRRELWELYLFAFVSMLSVVMVFISGRFRLPVFSVMAMFAALAVWHCIAAAGMRDYKRLIAPIAGFVLLIVVLNLYRPEAFRIRPNDFGMLSAYYDMAQRQPEALALLQDAERYYEAPDRGDAEFEQARATNLFFTRSSLANRLAQAGQIGEAIASLEKQVTTGVFDINMVKMLLYAYIETGNKQAALNLATQLARQDPSNPEWQGIVQQLQVAP